MYLQIQYSKGSCPFLAKFQGYIHGKHRFHPYACSIVINYYKFGNLHDFCCQNPRNQNNLLQNNNLLRMAEEIARGSNFISFALIIRSDQIKIKQRSNRQKPYMSSYCIYTEYERNNIHMK